MQWEAKLESQAFSIESGIEKGRPLPDWYLDEPVLEQGDVFYIIAFGELNTTRSTGMGVGSIPWDTIVRYGVFHKLDEELLKVFIPIIMGLDRKLLTRLADKTTEKPKPRS